MEEQGKQMQESHFFVLPEKHLKQEVAHGEIQRHQMWGHFMHLNAEIDV